MARTRTVDFLPPIFQTQTNKQFLSATLDQLVQEPQFKQSQGFIGRRVGPGVNPNDRYVVEPDASRANYQLEPGVISLVPDTNKIADAITYPGITDALLLQGAITNQADRLYTSEYYSWDPFVNFDKFVNFSQYYWLPAGPEPVDVSATVIPLTDDFTVTRSSNSYEFTGLPGTDPVITLVRGGTYNFILDQPGYNFWIQAEPGINGTLSWAPNISSRDVFGVVNNGAQSGTVTFNVPLKTDQQFYYNLTQIASIDLVTDLKFSDINNIYLTDFLAQYSDGIDGITSLNNRTIIFTNQNPDVESGGWYRTTQYDPLATDVNNNGQIGSFDTTLYDQTTPILTANERYSVWMIQYQYDNDGNVILILNPQRTVNNLEKFTVLFGTQWSNTQWFKNAQGYFEKIPLLTAIENNLWYQDSVNPEIFGRISLVDQSQVDYLNVDDIIGQKNYTSPTGVIFTNNMIVQFRGNVTPEKYQNNTYYVAGVGTAIQLLPTINYVTPEVYTKSNTVPYDSTPYDQENFDSNLNQPLIPDYLTVALDSPDLNAWARSNRWFHIDVINAAAGYNNTVAILDQNARAKRPILEFRGGTRLFKMGTAAKQPVNIVDFQETDALSSINGTIGYSIDGYPFINGSRVIFAADRDPQVRNKIYQVEFIEPSSDGSSIEEPCINLVPAADAEALVDNCVVCLSGITLQGKSFYFDGIEWVPAQEKTGVNQAPLFDVFDTQGFSFGNLAKYPSSTFNGSKLFSYAIGSGAEDTVLGFPLRYLTLNNVGDIVFNNDLYTDTLIYVENNVSVTVNVSDGFVRQYFDRIVYNKEIGWQTAATKSNIYQQFRFIYEPNTPFVLDVLTLPQNTITVPAVKVFVGPKFLDENYYTVTLDPLYNQTTITFGPDVVAVTGDQIEVLALSDQVSQVGFYQVPTNLENNPFNENSSEFTLGTIRTHYESICENLLNLRGIVNGSNNIRDLGNVVPYGLNILQQSSPMTLSGYFLRKPEYQIFESIKYNSREYEKFKAKFLNAAVTTDWEGLSIPEILTAIFNELSAGKTNESPFYWSDMLPASSVFTQHQYTITPISNPDFDTDQVYNFKSSNYLALSVYLNNRLLTRGIEYEVSTTGPDITISENLVVGDVITIQEFTNTAGNFVPNTPTKMGLYPAYVPELYLDETYIEPQFVIRGHDGSITVAFNDFRDELLLEFERRIYNNLKLDGNPVPLTADQVVPGQFRTTDYTIGEINQILATDFLTWVGWNKLDYKTQEYSPTNEFTWNYSTSSSIISPDSPLEAGAWRGIYNYFYDTIYPNTRPWEMLGFTKEPEWWQDEYGPAPYTNGNLVLWDDLEAGIVRDPVAPYVLPKYRRPGLTQVIPAGSEGKLLSPYVAVVNDFDQASFRKSWIFGDDGPVESAWRTSSSYPFAVMRLLALSRPAEFFSLFADRDLYKFDVELDQYLYNGRYRLDANGVQVYGNGVSKASYINWIVDFNRQFGIDSTAALTADLKNLDVRLCYRMAGFSGKNLIDLYTEKSSPNSLNSTLLLPDESYNLLMYKNVPFDSLVYSSVIVQRTIDGYAVYGYSTQAPFFNILVSNLGGQSATIEAGGYKVNVAVTHTDKVAQVPYGYVFTTRSAIVDFLVSYGALLQKQGMIFDTRENGYVLDWNQMASEFLYWSGQGWSVGSVINLNPTATQIQIERPGAIVDSLSLQTQENLVLDQNKNQLDTKNLIIDRQDNRFGIQTTANGQTINYLSARFVSYENMIVLDNQSIFADLIYRPSTGARQERLKLVATQTDQWNGQLDAQGFILNQNNVKEWDPTKKYTRGDIVFYKNFYYSAIDFVQPSTEFNFNVWTRSDYTKIQQGLLPNLPLKSNQLANSYDIYKANLENDQDLFSFGLIGFRPRQYMAALNLDSISQVNLYRQFLGTKGTTRATDIFSFADLGRGTAEYNIRENWGVQRGTYGANANRSYYEIQLNEALLQSNPSLVQVIQPGQESMADQTVLLQNLWKESFKLTSPNILTTIYPKITDTAFPNAGYVDLDDVDITVFDIDNPTELNANLTKLGVGITVWAAKVNNYDWNIYRVTNVPGIITNISSNLNNTSIVNFDRPHGLVKDSLFIIKYFSDTIDGTYRVLRVPSLNSVEIEFNFDDAQVSENGYGTAFYLQTQRVLQSSDVVNLPYANDILPGAKVWIDNNGDGHWEVIEKQDVFTAAGQLEPANLLQNADFGISVAQGYQNLFALVGAPGFTSGGGVYTFVKTDTNPFEQNTLIQLTAPATERYGHSVSVGNQNWMVAGAPDSYNKSGWATVIYRAQGLPTFEIVSLLTNPIPNDLIYPGEFGYSVAMSQDERWMYIGAPGINSVYAYGRVDVEHQEVIYYTDGLTGVFDFSNVIEIEPPSANLPLIDNQQLVVILNDQLLIHNFDYILSTPTSVQLLVLPLKDLKLVISRRESTEFTGDGVNRAFSLNAYFYSVANIESFIVSIDGVQQRPNIDYEYNDDYSTAGRDIIFFSPPALNAKIGILARSYFKYVDRLTAPAGVSATARFGHSVSCTTDGRQVLVGCPYSTNNGLIDSGSLYVFDRGVQQFIVDDAAQTDYTVDSGQLIAPTSVLLNNVFLVNEEGNPNGTFSTSGGTVTISETLNVGDIIEIETNEFYLIQTITSSTPGKLDTYGYAVDGCVTNCSLYIGAPTASITKSDGVTLQAAGYVERRVNQSRVYGAITSTNATPILVPGDTLRINNMIVTVPDAPNNNVEGLADAINNSGIPNVLAFTYPAGSALYGLLTLVVKNINATIAFNRLSVLPGPIGTAFSDLGFNTYAYTQTIQSPFPVSFAKFGQSLFIDTSAFNLVIGAPGGTLYRPDTFDFGFTTFDSYATRFYSPVTQSGVTYVYNYLPSADDSVSNPGKFVFGQQIRDNQIDTMDQFGTSVDYTNGVLLVGSPGSAIGISDGSTNLNYGRVGSYYNLTNTSAWVVTRMQQPVVDISLIDSVYTYSEITGAKTNFFDFIDPLQGKILGVARQNIDYFGAVDPAQYNVGSVNNYGNYWSHNYIGKIWWDTNTVRFIDPNQDDIVYASRRWSQTFPGSSVDVYQWIDSSVPPADYTGPGTPKDITSYAVSNDVTPQGILTTTYYFWVKNLTSVANAQGKTLSTFAIAQYIENPRGSGIPFVAFINASTTALYNAIDLISAQDTILNIEFDRIANDDNVHVQYDLIAEDDPEAFLSANLYRKLQDSFCGVDTVGNLVPDTTLSPANRYGVQFRPRQSMFANRYSALKNYLTRVNSILFQYPITEMRSFKLLNSKESEPASTSGEWDKRVTDLEQLSYQNFRAAPVGYRYLVDSDSSQNGLWTIYQNTEEKTFEALDLYRIQNYDTSRYWQYVNWYFPGYNSKTQIVAEVSTYSALATLNVSVGSSVRVTSNSQGKWEIYLLTNTEWQRVGLQDGTVAIKEEIWNYQVGRFGFDVEVFDAQYYDQEPVIETRKIIQAINQELLIGELLIERNRALILMFNFILSEFQAPEWLIKTSLVDVQHKIRALVPYQVYQQDNQDFVVDYIKEVKPYHVQIREINLIYDGFDVYQGTMTDFDVPAYYNTQLIPPKFVSPVLVPYDTPTAVGTGTTNTESDTSADDPLWAQQPWSDWYNNYLLGIQAVIVTNGGQGYTVAPKVVVTGECITPAKMLARTNSAGQVSEIVVLDFGSGYSTTAIIELVEGNGTGARAVAVMGNSLVRSIKTTIKYDRYEYNSDIVFWEAGVTYTTGTQVRYVDKVWEAKYTINTDSFDPTDWNAVQASSLSGVNRTQGFYAPAVNEPGLDLPLLIDGIDYPGVQVSAPAFDQDTGFDVGNYDINPFDNISYGPEGRPTYDPAILDAIYQSQFLDPYLGTRAIDINVAGGEFVDTYSSHAPEELVPGAEFDTLDFRVYTQPGADWENNGHGFPWKIVKWTYNSITSPSYSFADVIQNPVQIIVTNQTQGRDLTYAVNYSIDWNSGTVSIIPDLAAPPAADDDVLVISVYGIGGGNQIYKNSFNGAEVGNSITIPVALAQTNQVVIFVNEVLVNNYTYSAVGSRNIEIEFDTTYQLSDYINITVMGTTTTGNYSWSTPVTQYFLSNGQLDYSLDNSLEGTNPANLVVEKNGIRARPPEGAEYIADGSSAYPLPSRGGYSQALIADNDVQVWINNVPQTLSVDFTVEPYNPADDFREVIFATTPESGATILIVVWTKADYTLQNDGSSLYNNILVFRNINGFIPIFGDVISVTSWNDTSQQDILTLVFQGPENLNTVLSEGYDDTDYDSGTVNDAPGSYSWSAGAIIQANNFQLGRNITDPTRLWVTFNGERIFYGEDFVISGQELLLDGPVIKVTDVLAVELFTDSLTPEALEFRIFQDMRGVQATYRMTPATTTTLVNDLTTTDDIIYVNSVAGLANPNLANNVWGIVTINGERIMYREIDDINNTIIGLRRGTAGTAIANHYTGAIVYNLNRDNLLYPEYQDRYVTNYALGDGSTVEFVASDINLSASTKPGFNMADTIQVYVGGILQTSGYTVTSIAPATVEFDQAPTSGYQVTIQVRQALSWYQPGSGTASNGVALQATDTLAAQFFRGL
jgi:hypothetical protein